MKLNCLFDVKAFEVGITRTGFKSFDAFGGLYDRAVVLSFRCFEILQIATLDPFVLRIGWRS